MCPLKKNRVKKGTTSPFCWKGLEVWGWGTPLVYLDPPVNANGRVTLPVMETSFFRANSTATWAQSSARQSYSGKSEPFCAPLQTLLWIRGLEEKFFPIVSNVASTTSQMHFTSYLYLCHYKVFIETLTVAQTKRNPLFPLHRPPPWIVYINTWLKFHRDTLLCYHCVSCRMLVLFAVLCAFYLFMRPVKYKTQFLVADNRFIIPSQ